MRQTKQQLFQHFLFAILIWSFCQNATAQNICNDAISIVGTSTSADMSIATNDNNETDFGAEPNYQFCGNGTTIANCETANWHNAYYMTNYNDLWFVANISNGTNTFDVNFSNFAGSGYLYVLPYASAGDCSSLSLMDISNSSNSVANGSCPTINDNGTITFSGDAIATASANPIYLRVIAHENSASSDGTACSAIAYPSFDITVAAPQANDICADAIDIDNMTAAGNLCSAAIEAENAETGANCSESAENNDLWYSVTMDANDNDQLLQVGVTFSNAADAVVVELYSNCFSNTFIECATLNSLGAGTTKVHQFASMITANGFGPDWYIRVRPAAGNSVCDFVIQANRVAENNSCDIANEVFPTAFTITNPVVANFNFATPSGVDAQNVRDLWYVFDPIANTDSYGHTTYSTQADIDVADLNTADELSFMLYKKHGSTGANCVDLAAHYLATAIVSSNGTNTISCLDEIHGTSGTGDGYLLRVLQTAGNAYATPTITVTPSNIETPFNNSCENIWNGNAPAILGSTGIDAAHHQNAYYMLAGETQNGSFSGATDCDSDIISGTCNGIDYAAITETDDRDLWYAFEVPTTTCSSNMQFTYNASNAFYDGVLYI